jgi:hypothetical protein
MNKPKTVTLNKLSTIAMVNGNEKKHPRVILDDHVKNWVGFGWVDEGKATEKDKKDYPTVID